MKSKLKEKANKREKVLSVGKNRFGLGRKASAGAPAPKPVTLC